MLGYFSLPFLTILYLFLPTLTFSYISLPFLTFPYLAVHYDLCAGTSLDVRSGYKAEKVSEDREAF